MTRMIDELTEALNTERVSRVYLSAQYDTLRGYMQSVSERLERRGFEITSRWHVENEPTRPQSDEDVAEWDIQHIRESDAVVYFGAGESTGKAFEAGMALAWEKVLIIVSAHERRNLFYSLADAIIDVRGG